MKIEKQTKIKKKKFISNSYSKVNFENRSYLIGLMTIMGLGAFLRIYKLGANSLWSDEIRQVIESLWRSKNLSDLSYWAALTGQSPLDYIILRFFVHSFAGHFGVTEFLFRLPAAIWGILLYFRKL